MTPAPYQPLIRHPIQRQISTFQIVPLNNKLYKLLHHKVLILHNPYNNSNSINYMHKHLKHKHHKYTHTHLKHRRPRSRNRYISKLTQPNRSKIGRSNISRRQDMDLRVSPLHHSINQR